MKQMLKRVLVVVVIMVVIFLIAPRFTKNRTGMIPYMIDLANPFVTTEEVYGLVPEKYSSSWKDAANGAKDYGYEVVTYNASGKKRTLLVTTFGAKIESSVKFLKIQNKGQRVSGYDYVDVSTIPKNILKDLEDK